MNSRQLLLQKLSVAKEKQMIKDLGRLYRSSSRDIRKQIEKDSKSIKEITDEIKKLDSDDPMVAVLKSRRQAKVYSKQYQESLQNQIGTILDDMNKKQYESLSTYLSERYDDGYIGAMYDLHGQGIPLAIPIDQQQMVHTVKLQSKISEGLYSKLVKNTGMLKLQIRDEVTRGMILGSSYHDIARSLEERANIGLNRSIRIARTEGHRIQVTANYDALIDAKEVGADVVKQWDSSLDGKVRPTHRKVDGEIKELDEPFSNGLMFPGDPNGKAAEVINCRCALLQRALWALDEDELEELKQRADYFGLDKSDSFEEFKKKYIEIAKDPNIIRIEQLTKEKDELERVIASKYDLDKKYKDKLGIVDGGSSFTLKDYDKYKDDIKRSIDRSRSRIKLTGDDVDHYVALSEKGYSAKKIFESIRIKVDVKASTLRDFYGLDVDTIEYIADNGDLREYLEQVFQEYNKAIETFYYSSADELEAFVKLAKGYAKEQDKISDILSEIKKINRKMLSNSALVDTSFAARTQSAEILNKLQEYAEKKIKADSDVLAGLSRWAKKQNMTLDEAREKANQALKNIIDESDIGMRIRGRNLKLVLKDDDGGFKNLFEVGHSGGCSDTHARYKGEKSAFGFTKHHDRLTLEDKQNMPVYGMFIPKTDSQRAVDYIASGPGSWYGDGITCVIKKNKVFNNASFTLGDSLDYRGEVFGSTLDEPTFNGSFSPCGFDYDTLMDENKSSSEKLVEVFRYSDQYLEVQIHGKENHGYDIIEKVYFDKNASQQHKDIMDILDDKGIPYEILDD